MIYSEINISNIRSFLHLVPAWMLGRINDPAVFGLGALDDSAKHVPEGAIIFEVMPDSKEVVIRWLFVREALRGQGIGSGLMDCFFEALTKIDHDRIIADIPEGVMAEEVQELLSLYRFRFETAVEGDLLQPFSELIKNHTLAASRPHKDYVNMGQVDIKDTMRFLMSLKNNDKAKRVLTDINSVDKKISCVHRLPMGVDGAFLVKKHMGGMLEPVFLLSQNADRTAPLRLLHASICMVKEIYPSDQAVYLKCFENSLGGLLDYIVPDIHPVNVRRGVHFVPGQFF